MITIQAKVRCDARNNGAVQCKEETTITLSFSEESVSIGTDEYGYPIKDDRVVLQIEQSPSEWDINTTTSKHWCPKHNGRTPI